MDENNKITIETESSEYEPNFILKPDPAETVQPAETTQATETGQPRSSENPADALQAARAKADALRAAAARVDQAGEPYRRETSEFRDPTEIKQPSGRPAFENPSFDPGITGSYTDPRDQFRAGESASWSNGEVHRSRKQMKESIHKQKKQKAPAKPIMLTRKALALLIAGCLCLSCLFGLGGAAMGITLVQKTPTGAVQTTATDSSSDSGTHTAGYTLESATGSTMTIKEITAAAKSSVVEIRTESASMDSWMQQYVTEGAGSGVIINEDGYIMTNNHVINGANKIKVTTSDKKEYEAELVGTDETNDVAVLKIDASGLTPATYGNSSELEVGDMAVAIGNPLGELGGTVTAGIISATDRELTIDGKTMHLLQTDSSINPGNSGGGLFNGNGQLIGLVVAKSSGSDVEGLGFAIPINTAADCAQQLIDKGYVSGQPSTGMTYQEGQSSSATDPFGGIDSLFGSSGQKGVFIYSVNGENAKAAGFEPGDQVYAVDGEEITDFDSLSAIISSHKVGDTVKFTIIRGGQQKNIKLELEEKTPVNQKDSGNDQNSQSPNGQDQNGQNGQNGQENPFSQDQGGTQNDPFSQDQGGSWQDWFNMFF
ncbi:MAG: trypsin-like peptidase domain-containing protein [Firmicutes bacterium]|nr:trypsin-like peptidase domain-containing protein [Bacillota bacterium]